MSWIQIKRKTMAGKKSAVWTVVVIFMAAIAFVTAEPQPNDVNTAVEDTERLSETPELEDGEDTGIEEESDSETDDDSGSEAEAAVESGDIGEGREGFKLISFQKGTTINDALRMISAKYEQNIIPSSDVKGELTFTKLYNVTFEEAMEAILGDDYTYEEKNGIIKVYNKTNKNRMRHKMFTLYYTNVTEAKKVITPLLSDSGKIEATAAAETGVPADESISSNMGDGGDNLAMNDTIIVYDFPENLARIEEVLNEIDKRPRQVLVEAAILSVSLNEDMQFGVDWQTLKGSPVSGLGDLSQGDPDYFSSKGGSQVTASGGLAAGVVNGDISTFIRAVESVTDVTLLANPKILAVNKQLGQVYIGTKLGYVSQTTQTETSTTQEVKFLDTGTKLSFRPYIGNDGYIRMDIHPKDSSGTIKSVGDSNSTRSIPDETSAELVTNILVKDEQTVVIGGLFRDKITTNKTQIPILGDIPIIGNLFKGTSDSIVRKEVMVLLTPHIIEKPSEMQGDKREGDYERAKYGAYKGLHQLGRTRIAQDCYKRAVKYYENEQYEKALAELETALKIHPTYIEALRLQEELLKETSSNEFQQSGRVLIEKLREKQAPKWDK